MSEANDSGPLSMDELAIWHALKRLSETALAVVGADIEAATGLSGADFGILSRLEDLGDGALPQRELAKSLSWHKARLSHQLTRMEGRALVRRDSPEAERGVRVSILPAGRAAIAAARPVHAAAIRKHLLGYISPDEARALIDVVGRIERAAEPLPRREP